MSRSNMNCYAVSITLKIMFYRDTQALVIHISRGSYIARNVHSRRYMNRQRILFVALHRFSFAFKRHTFFKLVLSKFDVLVMQKHWQPLSLPEMTP